MAKNLMADVAKLLGVELEEEFMISNTTVTLKISAEDGLMYKLEGNENWEYGASDLQDLLMGELEIVKLPWKPKFKEGYYYPQTCEQRVFYALWVDSTIDYAMYNLGICYKTEEEAEEHFAEDYKKLMGKELE